MPLVHDRYTASAREFISTDALGEPTGKRVWTSCIGQKNVDLGNGEFTDSVINAKDKFLRFGESEVKLTVNGLEFWHNGELKLTSKLQLESKAELSSTWDRPEAVVSGFKVSTLPTEKFADVNQIEYKLTVEDQELTVKICSWGLDRVTFIFEKEALKSGEQRILWETEVTEKTTPIIATFDPDKNKESKTIGLDFGGHAIKWTQVESDSREIINADVGKKTAVAIERKIFEASERSVITPDTWGATQIQADNDDAFEIADTSVDLDGLDGDGINFGRRASSLHDDPCLRWDNVTCSGTAENGCKLSLDMTYEEGSTSTAGAISGIDEADPDDWSAGTRPSQRNKTTANVGWQPTTGDWGTGNIDSPEIKTIIQELIDSYTYSGSQAMAFTWVGAFSGNHYRQFEDFNTEGTPAQLTIVYTPAAGGVTLEIDVHDCQDMGECLTG